MIRISPKNLGLWVGILGGLSTPALSQTRHPVITRVEILFSMVSHYNYLADQASFYNTFGSPQGNTNYAIPHLAYEPIVTLYNPYNEPMTMNRSRIKIWDPPVGFAFQKNDVHLRPEFGMGEFHGLARFQIANELNTFARKSFTLLLSSPRSGNFPGGRIVLQPGESRTFSSWVETNWTWAMETAGGYDVRSFCDWNYNDDFTNRDGRTANSFGAEALPSPVLHFPSDPRAGFQTDGLSYYSYRPLASRYDFEIAKSQTRNSVTIRLSETVGVQAKAMRTYPAYGLPDFQVDLLKGQSQDPKWDTIKTFPMSLTGVIQDPGNPVISRTFRVGDILQTPGDTTAGGKTPFASFTMLAKASAVRANRFYSTPAVPASELYELHFNEVADFGETPVMPSDAPSGGLEILGFSRSGETLFIDFKGAANAFGISPWKVRGTSSLADGFPDDLGSVTTVMAGQSGSGIYKAIIDLAGLGDRYFVRIEE